MEANTDFTNTIQELDLRDVVFWGSILVYFYICTSKARVTEVCLIILAGQKPTVGNFCSSHH